MGWPSQEVLQIFSSCSPRCFNTALASYDNLASVAYFVYIDEFTDQRSITIALGKASVLSLKPLTIARLEFQAALIGVRLANFVIIETYL